MMMTMTGSVATATTHDFSGLAGLAVRAGRALERWGSQAAQPLTRVELEQRRAIELEARRASAARDSALHGMYQVHS
jgi:hypothetical protein